MVLYGGLVGISDVAPERGEAIHIPVVDPVQPTPGVALDEWVDVVVLLRVELLGQ